MCIRDSVVITQPPPNPVGVSGDNATWSQPFLGLLKLSDLALDGRFAGTLQDAIDKYQTSATTCAVLAHTLFHEGLHAKLVKAGSAQDDCSYISNPLTAPEKSCKNTTEPKACIDPLKASLAPGAPPVEPHPDYPEKKNGEPDQESLKRFEKIKSGPCSTIQINNTHLDNKKQKAGERFCGNHPWQTPCPAAIKAPNFTTNDDQNQHTTDEVLPSCSAFEGGGE